MMSESQLRLSGPIVQMPEIHRSGQMLFHVPIYFIISLILTRVTQMTWCFYWVLFQLASKWAFVGSKQMSRTREGRKKRNSINSMIKSTHFTYDFHALNALNWLKAKCMILFDRYDYINLWIFSSYTSIVSVESNSISLVCLHNNDNTISELSWQIFEWKCVST